MQNPPWSAWDQNMLENAQIEHDFVYVCCTCFSVESGLRWASLGLAGLPWASLGLPGPFWASLGPLGFPEPPWASPGLAQPRGKSV